MDKKQKDWMKNEIVLLKSKYTKFPLSDTEWELLIASTEEIFIKTKKNDEVKKYLLELIKYVECRDKCEKEYIKLLKELD